MPVTPWPRARSSCRRRPESPLPVRRFVSQTEATSTLRSPTSCAHSYRSTVGCGNCAPHVLLEYRDRLNVALERFDNGDTASMTSPLTDGYHTVWMWLHQHVLMMLGLTRAEDEALEEELVRGSAE
jgi:hypothetical protein